MTIRQAGFVVLSFESESSIMTKQSRQNFLYKQEVDSGCMESALLYVAAHLLLSYLGHAWFYSWSENLF